jgi:hypothetical protein
LKLIGQLRRSHRETVALRFRSVWLVLFFLVSEILKGRAQEVIIARSQNVISGINKAQEDREQKLSGYAAIEHYTVRNSHFSQSAELTAKVIYQRGEGKTYQILSRRGPVFLQKRVINRILDEDTRLSRSAERPHNLLTSANYLMQVQGTQVLHGTLCYLVSIQPRVHHFSLIEGTAWIDVKRFTLLRIEGKPAASPSLWTGRPLIEREYNVLDGFSFPQHSRATSQGLFSGKSELDIDYSQYVIFSRHGKDTTKHNLN